MSLVIPVVDPEFRRPRQVAPRNAGYRDTVI